MAPAKVTAASAKVASAIGAKVAMRTSAITAARMTASTQRPNTLNAPSAGQTSSTSVRIERSSKDESNSEPPRNVAGPNSIIARVRTAVTASPAGRR